MAYIPPSQTAVDFELSIYTAPAVNSLDFELIGISSNSTFSNISTITGVNSITI